MKATKAKTPLVLKIGTRRSLLAMAQSSWVAQKLMEIDPNIEVQLHGIVTRGDQIQDKPLYESEGKDFFVAELDEALRKNEVDLTVHSFKDLSLDRPSEFTLAAVPSRENPRDFLLVHERTLEKLRHGQGLRIGTSAPRRLENLPPFLLQALPNLGKTPLQANQLEMIPIRGNVNTRLKRLHLLSSDAKNLDGIVIALAGLIRLWEDQKGKAELQGLLKNLKWMLLPLELCPSAPGQGALAIECRSSDHALCERLKKLHSQETAQQVKWERDLLKEWGGGCHQSLGATAIDSGPLGRLLYLKGRTPSGKVIQEMKWYQPPSAPEKKTTLWDGSEWRAKLFRSVWLKDEIKKVQKTIADKEAQATFLSHSRALPDDMSLPSSLHVWTSGISSWFRLAQKGIWVEGCSEGLGFDSLLETLKEPVLRLPDLPQWVYLTHDQAKGEWESVIKKEGLIVGCTYQLIPQKEGPTLQEAGESLGKASHIFWSSISQYELLKTKFSRQAHHACGPGKTFEHLQKNGISSLQAFPSVEEWKKWLDPAI